MSTPTNALWDILPGRAISMIVELEARGFTLSIKGDKLIVAPASKLEPYMRELITEHRDGILAAVLLCSDEVVARALEIRNQLDHGRCVDCDREGPRCRTCSLAHIVAYQVPTPVKDILAYHDGGHLR